jgi:diguanylate cyclase (GGDEF)-like protein/PAS domain S-box-containing protein
MIGEPAPRLLVLVVAPGTAEAQVLREALAPYSGPTWLVEAATPDDSIRRLATTHADAALLDLRAPGRPDLDALGRLTGAFPALPVVVLVRDEASGVAALRLGAQDYLAEDAEDGRLLSRALRHAVERKRITDSLRQLEAAVRTMQLGVSITDAEGRIVYLNKAEAEMHGYAIEELLGKDARNLSPREQWKALPARELEHVTKWKRERMRLRKDGTRFPVQLMSDVVTDAAGRPWGLVTTCEDITERWRAEEALRDSEERYALAVRGTNDGIWDWSIKEQRIYLSPRWKAMLGYGEHDLGDSPDEWFSRVHPEDRERVDEKVQAHLQRKAPHFEDEYRMRHRDGSYRWVLSRGFAVRDGEGRPTRMAGAQTDVTDRRAYDPLTGLPNRALFAEKLEEAFDRAGRRSGYFFAVIFLDLDRFKSINDALGHLVGDGVLMGVAKRLSGCLRPGDTVARFGGDEFAILLDRIADADDASLVADRIQRELQAPLAVDGREVPLSASMGIALSTTGYSRSDELLRDADAAMFNAKRLGRTRYQLFDAAMRERMAARAQMEESLQRAVRRGEFHLLYQPVYALAPRRLIAMEALLRWRQPDGRELAPADFLGVAEATGQIHAIGTWALREACRQMKSWLDRSDASAQRTVDNERGGASPRRADDASAQRTVDNERGEASPRRADNASGLLLLVNLAGRQLARRSLTDDVAAALNESGLPPQRLRIEITERALEGTDAAAATLSRLRAMGVGIHLDDFGTGAASLALLDRFPIDALKLDRPLVALLAEDGAPGLVRSILAVARTRGLSVIAEGVETQAQLDALVAHGCDHGQGFLLGAPVAPDEAGALIAPSVAVPTDQGGLA